MTPVVQVQGIHKRYGRTVAVDDVSFEVGRGEIFGLLGPNGAGKTTTVECVIGLRVPDSGTLRVLGLDPAGDDRHLVRERVGAQLQQSAVAARLTVHEAMELYASFYRDPADPDELLSLLDLEDKRDTAFRKLSGGQKQRLSIALALIGNPEIAVLDELTTGLDPQSRRDTWHLVERVRDRGVTVILVTHYMDEAERLCDRIAVIDAGRVIALGRPAEVTARTVGGKRVHFRPSGPFPDALLTELPVVDAVARRGARVTVSGSGDLVNAVVLTLDRFGVTAHDVDIETPGLEDAFLALIDPPVREGALQ